MRGALIWIPNVLGERDGIVQRERRDGSQSEGGQ